MTKHSRRAFLVATAAAGALRSQNSSITAGEVIERIQKNVGVPWRAETVDTFKAGSPQTPVKGIATTMMATLDVLQRSAAAGRNLVITHEPTFYSHQDGTDLSNDPVYQFKADFIRKNNMAVWRFHDHWHAHRPDGIATGMIEELGWAQHVDSANPRRFIFDNLTLGQLAREMQSKLKIRTMRVVGDPNLRLRSVAANWGYTDGPGGMRALSRPDVDALIVGESREWEVVEYADDAVAAGMKKGLIVLGHIPSEQAGMKHCARWLKSFVTEVPIDFVAANEPFWTPSTSKKDA